ncbi:hypothetical protein DFQ28_009302 [Apophysomyces sp. BC1034]|nr:hypothetical protein DFQ30_009040 [Apophysomyces sp. BC1015]KAG0173217.1 hypothetical protein DFQ29_008046 [Apophysomyces sp. BC1021]KAG0185445.1 hypothetical protein DFQ28_009302 [Apophysomyces sp. BC1034]
MLLQQEIVDLGFDSTYIGAESLSSQDNCSKSPEALDHNPSPVHDPTDYLLANNDFDVFDWCLNGGKEQPPSLVTTAATATATATPSPLTSTPPDYCCCPLPPSPPQQKEDMHSFNFPLYSFSDAAFMTIPSNSPAKSENGRKRKHDEDFIHKKVAHNAIERRYRNNINDRIQELKNVVPALYKAKATSSEDDEEDSEEEERIVDGVPVAKKLNKATILHKATEYIEYLKHTNDLVDRENRILEQILAQLPNGAPLLARFQVQKREFQEMEQQRLAHERRESREREKLERQRMLRERAAQRAALAELVPKPERRPYKRRASKRQNQQPKSDNKMFTVMFMCLALFATSPNTSSSMQHHATHGSSQSFQLSAATTDYRSIFRYAFYVIVICYFLIIPLMRRFLRVKPAMRPMHQLRD